MTSYYKATDGTFTVFRSTTSRTYAYADLTARDGSVVAMGFGNLKGALKAVEIDKVEYQGLVATKIRRTTADVAKARAAGQPLYAGYNGHEPGNSWIRNADLVEPAVKAKAFREAVAKASANISALLMKEEAAPPVTQADPTKATYLNLTQAYDYLNAELFNGKLPSCLVTLQRKANTRGYFAGARFATRDGLRQVDEIALNPSTFKERDTRCILSTLAHEMVHLEQHHTGKPGKAGYHNREWADWMLRIGLKPVSIDQPGKMVGTKVTHEIVSDGPFDVAAAALVIKQRVIIDYVEAWTEETKAKAAKKLKVKYSCPACGQNAWAKPDAHLACGDCDEAMEAEEG